MKKDQPRFRPGMKVKKTLHGIDSYKEASDGEVDEVKDGIVYLTEGRGITYDAETGRELENFFLPMYCEIEPA